MTHSWVEDAKFSTAPVSPSCRRPTCSQSSTHASSKHRNVFLLLSQREISPQTKHHAKKLWVKTSKCKADSVGLGSETIDPKHALFSWIESESLHHWTAKYCPLLPPPRSTIAAAFSSDGRMLASTHGDHTVKIIDCQTGKCLKVLSGHRRTPWVVRFHPLFSDILASGSLDHEVRLWDAHTSDCIGSRDFYRPIASIAFHAQGELLAVASGHKLYIWSYNRRGEASSPAIVLKTRRSLRAVHFHPHGAPYLLTAEVNNLDSSDSPLTLATSSGYSYYAPAVFFTNINSNCCSQLEGQLSSSCLVWPTIFKDDGRSSLPPGDWAGGPANMPPRAVSLIQPTANSDAGNQHDQLLVPMDIVPGEPSGDNVITEAAFPSSLPDGVEREMVRQQYNTSSLGSFERSDAFFNGSSSSVPSRQSRLGLDAAAVSSSSTTSGNTQMLLRNVETGRLHHYNLSGEQPCWELPFLQGWLMGQTHTGLHPAMPANITVQGSSSSNGRTGSESPYRSHVEASVAPSTIQAATGISRTAGRRHSSRSHSLTSVGAGEGTMLLGTQNDEAEANPISIGVDSELHGVPTSFLSTGAAELPCTVKLRIWQHDVKDPCAPLDAEKCRITISHAVLCSEMGAHISPCGRYLVACVACLQPQTEGDMGIQSQMQLDAAGTSTSPTRHPLSSHRVIYELRIYSLEESTFGKVLASRAIRAANCLTSIQFSPTSEHILLAYGRRHHSLLRSVVTDGESTMHIYTILEVYRVLDMELIRVLPSAEDEVNVACFHPSPGGGLVYGTKEGKLRILQYDGPNNASCAGMNFFSEENMLEIQRYALEC